MGYYILCRLAFKKVHIIFFKTKIIFLNRIWSNMNYIFDKYNYAGKYDEKLKCKNGKKFEMLRKL